MRESILVVEDEATLRTNVARYLSRAGHTVATAACGRAALAELERRSFDIVITDLRLGDIEGLAVLDHVRASSPESVVLIMTAYASVDSAVEALRRGAHDYVLKPLSLADLLKKVEHIAEHQRLERENARLRTMLRGESDALTVLRRGGRTINDVCDIIEKVAASSANVLVVGESGSGKELVARAIHERSARNDGPMITLDVSAIPEALVDSQLFGHERNAFLGAERREGVFRAASGGTLFLDQIGELSQAVQSKLLRAVESKEIVPLGADQPLKVDTRIVAATHRDLSSMVASGSFRHDLLHRLSVVEIRLPPLRDRLDDVPVLATQFLFTHARAQRKPARAIAPDAMELLCRYRWPGNVRELSNVLERAVILSSGETLGRADLPAELGGTPPASTPPPASVTETEPEALDLETATHSFQRHHVARVLDRASGNREAAAKLLGLAPATFYRYLQKLGLKGYAS